MKKQLALLFILLITATAGYAQDYAGRQAAEQHNIWRAGLFIIEYERILAPNTTLVSQAGVAFAAGFGGRQIGWLFDYYPILGFSPRYYYNLDKRAEDGKDTQYFSGNYLSFFTRAYLGNIVHPDSDKNEYNFGPVWGMQRNIGHFQYGIHLGVGLGGPINDLEVIPLIGLGIGYRF